MSEHEPGSAEATDVRHERDPSVLAVVIPYAYWIAGAWVGERYLGARGVWLALIVLPIAMLVAPRISRRARIQIVGDVVRVRRRWGTRKLRLRTPRICQREERSGAQRLSFATTGGWLRMNVPDAECAEQLIQASHAELERIREFRIEDWRPRPFHQTRWSFLGVVGATIACACLTLKVGSLSWLIGGLAGAFWHVVRASRITLGREGFVFRSWGARCVVRWSQVSFVKEPKQAPRPIWLGHNVGKVDDSVTLFTGGKKLRLWAAPPHMASSYEKNLDLYHAIVAFKTAAVERDDVARSLFRRGRSLEQWRAGPGRDHAYRSDALDPAELSQRLDDPAVPAEARLGAALAMTASRDPPAMRRVRVIADNTVDPSLGAALSRVAEGTFDDAALAEFERSEAEQLPAQAPGVDTPAVGRMAK